MLGSQSENPSKEQTREEKQKTQTLVSLEVVQLN